MKQIKEFERTINEFISLVNIFPVSKREEVFLENWNLKDILVHLTGWAKYQKKILKYFKQNKVLKSQNNLKDLINGKMVLKNKKTKWEIVLRNFKKSTSELITEYKSLPKKYWTEKIFEDKDTTPEDFIKIETKHYKETHGPQVIDFIKNNGYKYCATIILKNKKILLLKRSENEPDESGKWCPVNETIEKDELPETAIIRGVKEEIGTHFTIVKQLSDHEFDGLTAVFLGKIKGKIKIDSQESSDYGWFNYQDTKKLDLAYLYENVMCSLHKIGYLY